jgi:Short-chain dehydrogenases of various substrate specificities
MKQDVQLRLPSRDLPLRDLRIAITRGNLGARPGAAPSIRRCRRLGRLRRARRGARDARRRQPSRHPWLSRRCGHKADIYPLATAIAGALGGLDVLINNASDLGPVPLALLGDTDCEDLERALATNLLGPFRLTKALLGALAASAREGRGGLVVNISSDAAVTPLSRLGRLWGEQGRPPSSQPNLESGAGRGGHPCPVPRPRRMDTPLHAAALPEADPALLKSPEDSARELIAAIEAALPRRPVALVS